MIFNSRETYLVAVSDWKQKYKQVSKDIRSTKLEFKKLQRENATYQNSYTACYAVYYKLKELRDTANELLAERVAGKREANIQYLASRVQI